MLALPPQVALAGVPCFPYSAPMNTPHCLRYARWLALLSAVFFVSTSLPAEAATTALSLHPNNPHYLLFRGKPTVIITSSEHYGAVLNLDFDFRPIEVQISDAAGRAVFKMPKAGAWQLNVIWSKPIKDRKADFENAKLAKRLRRLVG